MEKAGVHLRTLLFTGFNEAYRPLAELTVPLMQAYAKRHEFEFIAVDDPPKIPNGVYWIGVGNAHAALTSGFDRAIYLDVDQIITNPDVVLDFGDHGFHVSRDWGVDAAPGDFSMAGFIAHRDSIPLLSECMKVEPEWRNKPFPEQGPMRHLASLYLSPLQIHPRRVFNAVPIEVHPSVVDGWQIGDFCCHLTMLPFDERIALFHKIKKRVDS